jgi:RimJ/RimL family protein N-acetyltransferase
MNTFCELESRRISTIVRSESRAYPWELVRTIALRGDVTLRIRPIRPDDEPRLVALFHRLSLQTVYERFLTPFERLPATWYQHFANVDYTRRLGLVAEDLSAVEPALRAVASYEPSEAPGCADIAIVVEDAFQNRGLGTVLLDDLLRAAEARDIRRFRADVLAENRRILHVLGRLAVIRRRELDHGVLTIDFERQQTVEGRVA